MPRSTNNLVAFLLHSMRILPNQLSRYCLRRRLLFAAGMTASVACLLIYLIPALCVYGQTRKLQAYDPVPLAVPEAANLSTPFSRIAKEVGPAVVNINTEILPHAATCGDNGGEAEENGDDDSGRGVFPEHMGTIVPCERRERKNMGEPNV